jgi:hypothetical protein
MSTYATVRALSLLTRMGNVRMVCGGVQKVQMNEMNDPKNLVCDIEHIMREMDYLESIERGIRSGMLNPYDYPDSAEAMLGSDWRRTLSKATQPHLLALVFDDVVYHPDAMVLSVPERMRAWIGNDVEVDHVR